MFQLETRKRTRSQNRPDPVHTTVPGLIPSAKQPQSFKQKSLRAESSLQPSHTPAEVQGAVALATQGYCMTVNLCYN